MQVFKFGGASVKNPDGIKNVSNIIKHYGLGKPLMVVVSAIGKTTNQLEKVVSAKFNNIDLAKGLLDEIRLSHESFIIDLFGNFPVVLEEELNEHFTEAEWVIEETREMSYDYVYDQIVSLGELISSRILANWLIYEGVIVDWLDARSLIITNDTWREGRVLWTETNERIRTEVLPIIASGKVVLTQGFIGSTNENNTVTLGREGSDYTAAIISAALDAEAMIIWKDVPGVLTADPKVFENVTKIDRLSYTEAIEMTYYGAKVIHPKTIQPLENKNIPLFVKSFLEPEAEGTYISADPDPEYPPIVVVEKSQALIHFSSKDLSFIAEHHLARLFNLFEKHRIKVNMMRNTAISFTICSSHDSVKIKNLLIELKDEFKVVVDPDLDLYTVRHYNDAMLPKLFEEKIILLEERIKSTVQLVVKNAPAIIHRKSEHSN
jgi:aspartate kinase